MGLIRTENLEPGMVLADDVLDGNGWLLLTAGTKLTSGHIRNFVTREVALVGIEGVSQESVDQKKLASLDPQELQKLQDENEAMFRHNDLTDPFIEEVARLSLIRRVAQLQPKGDDV